MLRVLEMDDCSRYEKYPDYRIYFVIINYGYVIGLERIKINMYIYICLNLNIF